MRFGFESGSLLISAQKYFLHHVLGVGLVPHNGERGTVEPVFMLCYKCLEVLRPAGLICHELHLLHPVYALDGKKAAKYLEEFIS